MFLVLQFEEEESVSGSVSGEGTDLSVPKSRSSPGVCWFSVRASTPSASACLTRAVVDPVAGGGSTRGFRRAVSFTACSCTLFRRSYKLKKKLEHKSLTRVVLTEKFLNIPVRCVVQTI